MYEVFQNYLTFSENSGRNGFILPQWEQNPTSAIHPSVRVQFERMRAIGALLEASPSEIVFSTLEALSQKLPLISTLVQFSIFIKQGFELESREWLSQKLLNAGYFQVDTVTDVGTFAVRGELIDIFAPNHTSPIRIELFDLEVERIRSFDPNTQMSLPESELREAHFIPTRESFIPYETVPLVREKIKSLADSEGIPRAIRDPLFNQLQPGVYPEHSPFWAPFIHEKTSSFFESFQPEVVIHIDSIGCEQNWDGFKDDFKKNHLQALQEGRFIPYFEELFDPPKFPTSMGQIFLDQVRLSDLSELPDLSSEEGTDFEVKETSFYNLKIKNNSDFKEKIQTGFEHVLPLFQAWKKKNYSVTIFSATESQAERIRFILEQRGISVSIPGSSPDPSSTSVLLKEGALTEGFRWPAEKIVVLSETDFLGTQKPLRKSRGRKADSAEDSRKNWSDLQTLTDLNIGDCVVHQDHGIGRYLGIVKLTLQQVENEFISLEYANKDKLYLPVYRVNVIQKYMGSGEGTTILDRLGAKDFEKEKESVKTAVRKIAFDLIQLYAERQIRPGIRLSRDDDFGFKEFEAAFPYDETPDQLKAIDSVLDDLSSGKVMDRLICGDVGYGKTEVAIRAAFKTVTEGYQVAVLVPTTILCQQHENSFRARMQNYPIRVDSVSRFKSNKEQKTTLEDLEAGKVDILIGTHRLLSKDVDFKKLGLVIVDEEHRFGVEHKEKLKAMKLNTHILTLSATPIPRTLHMALSGIREISLITTPPINRLPVKTYIAKFDEELIKRAIEFELNRGGQVFFVHNRVQSIYEIGKKIKELVPRAEVGIGHAQMSEKELEKVMIDFYQKRTNVLVSTTIIESGIDIPNANTMLINRADHFGLAQLYQIRGRVGRGQNRAYAYLLLPGEGLITEDAKRRLEVIQKFVELGSGFSIASHDLEIRGGGDILGAAQSGHIQAVGFEMYMELLDEAVREIQGKKSTTESQKEPEIKVPFSAFLSEQYIPDTHQRLSLYRRLSSSSKDSEVDRIESELQDRFGKLPSESQNLLWLIRVKILLKTLRVDALTVGPERIVLQPGAQSLLDPVRAIALISSQPKKYQLTPESKFVAHVKVLALKELYFTLQILLKELQTKGIKS
jgi:transcription-repair coupling factor (superfamily II helicase)